jgi:16S rRNA (cytidine1402-2'-O)-methyltransferase
MEEIFGDRKAVVARELTKLFEETARGSISGILDRIENSKIAGEYVIMVEGRGTEKTFTMEDAMSEVRTLMKKGFGRKDAVKKVAGEYGLSKKELYDRSLTGE